MIYNLSEILNRERFKRRINQLYEKRCVVELTEKKPLRTIKQNSYLHLILGYFAIETGNGMDYVKREYFKILCNTEIFVREIDDKFLGKIKIVRSSSALDRGEMTTAIDRFRNWSAGEAGIYLPEPNENEFLEHIQMEMERNKQFL